MIKEKIYDNCERYPQKTAVLFKDISITYGELKERVEECVKIICRQRINKGEIVGIVFDNRPEFIYWLIALFSVGCPAALIPTYFKENEIGYHLEKLDLRICIVQNKYCQTYLKGMPKYSNDTYLILETNKECKQTSVYNTGERIVQFTSGSQGESKAVIRTETSLISEIKALDVPFSPVEQNAIFAPFVPIFHSYGLVGGTLFPLYYGKSVFLADVRYPKFLLEKMIKFKVTHMFSSPFLYESFCNIISGKRGTFDFSTDVKCFTAGAAMKQDCAEVFNKLTGLNIYQDYGSTETGTMAIGVEPVHLNSSLGKLFTNTDYCLLKLDFIDKEDCGELLIKSDIIDFYYLYPQQLNVDKFQNEFYKTGDIVSNENGMLSYVGRNDGMVNVNGLKVYLNEVENVLKKMECIKELSVNILEENEQQYICAYIVLKRVEYVSENDIKQYCRQYIADYKIPRKIIFLDELPQNSSGKILKKYLEKKK